MEIKELVNQLEEAITINWDEYTKLNEEFNKYTNRELNEEEGEAVKHLFMQIHDKFNELYVVFNFIAYRYQSSCNAVNGYNEFIERLKKSGNIRENEEKKIIS